MKKILKVGDGKTSRISIETFRMEGSENISIRIQPLYKTKKMAAFAPGRGGLSIPPELAKELRIALRKAEEAANAGDAIEVKKRSKE